MNSNFQCRSCGAGGGVLVLDLGNQPLANNFLRAEDLAKTEPRCLLRVFVCPQCWLLQITDLIPPVELFSDYLYFSSFSETMLRHAEAAALRYIREFNLGPQSWVVEIASNDGYLLQHFQKAGVPCLGIEPAANVAAVSRKNGIETWIEFFGAVTGQKIAESGRLADLILGNNVFAHAPDTNDFAEGLRRAVRPDGRIILEFPHALELVGNGEFDTIYHEHVFYFSLTAILPLFRRHGLEIFHVERIPIHGGSLRVFAGHEGKFQVQSSVEETVSGEARAGLRGRAAYRKFAEQAQATRTHLLREVESLGKEGKTLAAYGAAAKGTTLLNFCGLGRDRIDFVADRSPYKQGRFTPGTHIPIVHPDQLVRRMPAMTLLLTWNFAAEILEQQKPYRERGGKFLLPIPELRVL